MSRGLTYKQAGVDIDVGEALVERIKPLAARTRTPHVLADVGGFAGLCRIPPGMREPILVAATDGVGTKLHIAAQLGKHDTIGIDLVAMCVNDLICCGAQPLFFLDYYATGKLALEAAEPVLRGIAQGCELAGCALLGGETAEMPGSLRAGEYELAGFAVGVVERAAIIEGARLVQPGDLLLGLASSGLHANGYSLARQALLQVGGLSLTTHLDGLPSPLGEELLRPTRIYVPAVLAALELPGVHGLCHITGGGLPGNLPRILPANVQAVIDLNAWLPPPIFSHIARLGGVEAAEMRRAFNLGIGFVLVVAASQADALMATLQRAGEEVCCIGRIEPASPHQPRVAFA